MVVSVASVFLITLSVADDWEAVVSAKGCKSEDA